MLKEIKLKSNCNIELGSSFSWHTLGIPVSVDWWGTRNANAMPLRWQFGIGIHVLCFHFSVEIWRWDSDD